MKKKKKKIIDSHHVRNKKSAREEDASFDDHGPVILGAREGPIVFPEEKKSIKPDFYEKEKPKKAS